MLSALKAYRMCRAYAAISLPFDYENVTCLPLFLCAANLSCVIIMLAYCRTTVEEWE